MAIPSLTLGCNFDQLVVVQEIVLRSSLMAERPLSFSQEAVAFYPLIVGLNLPLDQQFLLRANTLIRKGFLRHYNGFNRYGGQAIARWMAGRMRVRGLSLRLVV